MLDTIQSYFSFSREVKAEDTETEKALREDLLDPTTALALKKIPSTPQGKGLVWEVSLKNRKIYLVGTAHKITPDQLQAFAPKLMPLVKRCQKIFLEADIRNHEASLKAHNKMVQSCNKNPSEWKEELKIVFSKKLASYLSRLEKYSESEISSFINKLDHNFLETAYHKLLDALQSDKSEVLELCLLEALQHLNCEAEIIGLHSHQAVTQIAFEMHSSLAKDKSLKKLPPLSDELINAVDKGAHKVFEQLRKAHQLSKYYKHFNRSIASTMIKELKGQSRNENALFIIGALHTSGDDGVITLLKKNKGIQIKRV
ncbi:MAG: hypothetical protein GWP59_03525 [Chlamydiales bacterium]|nr:hypothetical protein [Chlamydiales bacterium]